MEFGIIIALSLTVLILLFSLFRQRYDVIRLKRLEPEVVRLQKRVSEDVHKDSNLAAEITRLQTALSKEKQHNERLREAITAQADFKTAPPAISHDDDYWWALSTWYRQEQNWICEECGIDLRNRRYFLHTHHVYGRRWNDPKSLKALCIVCHAEEHNNPDFMTKSSDYRRFLRTPEYRNHARNRRIQQSRT